MKPSPSDELAPWLSDASDASPELRSFLRQATVSPHDSVRIERLRDRLGPWLTPPAPTPPPAADASGAAFKLAAAGKACVVAVGLSGIAVGVWASSRGPEPAPKPPNATAVVVSVPRQSSPPSTVANPVPTVSPSAARPLAAPLARRVNPAPLEVRRPSLAEEAAALAAAQRIATSSPQLGLLQLREHERKFPRGALTEERRLFTIQALVALGRREEARRELESFRRAAPRSPHLTRAQKLVGDR